MKTHKCIQIKKQLYTSHGEPSRRQTNPGFKFDNEIPSDFEQRYNYVAFLRVWVENDPLEDDDDDTEEDDPRLDVAQTVNAIAEHMPHPVACSVVSYLPVESFTDIRFNNNRPKFVDACYENKW